MIVILALLTALGAAVLNGAAAILEKVGSSKVAAIKSPSPMILWKLKGSIPYNLGILFDLLGWGLALFAVHFLPLFIVQPILACGIIVTVLIELYLLKTRLNRQFIISIIVIILGLVLLALTATPEKAVHTGNSINLGITLFPAILLILGILFSSKTKAFNSFVLAALGGLAFGGVAIAGRMIHFNYPLVKLLINPIAISLVAYGLIGIILFTIALQRSAASSANAIMIACSTLFPILVGLIFLGDHPKNNQWSLVVLGVLFTLSGTLLIAFRFDRILSTRLKTKL